MVKHNEIQFKLKYTIKTHNYNTKTTKIDKTGERYNVMIERFSYLLRLRRYKRKSVEVGRFSKGVGHIELKFQAEGASPTNHCWCQKTRVIALSCSIKISVVHCLVLSQSTYVIVTDRRTERQTELRQLVLKQNNETSKLKEKNIQ